MSAANAVFSKNKMISPYTPSDSLCTISPKFEYFPEPDFVKI